MTVPFCVLVLVRALAVPPERGPELSYDSEPVREWELSRGKAGEPEPEPIGSPVRDHWNRAWSYPDCIRRKEDLTVPGWKVVVPRPPGHGNPGG